MENTEFISLEALSVTLGLPRKYLRELSDTGKIPHLNVNGRLRFNAAQVRHALVEMAQSSAEGGAGNE